MTGGKKKWYTWRTILISFLEGKRSYFWLSWTSFRILKIERWLFRDVWLYLKKGAVFWKRLHLSLVHATTIKKKNLNYLLNIQRWVVVNYWRDDHDHRKWAATCTGVVPVRTYQTWFSTTEEWNTTIHTPAQHQLWTQLWEGRKPDSRQCPTTA